MVENSLVMNQLSSTIDILFDDLKFKNVIYCDIPVHGNIGDLLIMLGTIKFLKEHNITVKDIFSAYDLDFISVAPDDIIVLHGGGNLGDLYGLHQKFREKIISKYLNNKIIILPQTIYFESNDNYNRCCEIFSKHKNLYIYTRDKNSFELAKKMSNFVYLSPDMAHKLYPIKYKNKADKESIFIKRKDKELLKDNYEIDTKALVIDWCDILGIHNYIISAFIRLNKLLSILGIKFAHKFLIKPWIKYANFLVKKTVKVLSRYDVIYTTRMHGHILACLMDKENIVFDNSYGKNSNYIKQWTSSSKLVSLLK